MDIHANGWSHNRSYALFQKGMKTYQLKIAARRRSSLYLCTDCQVLVLAEQEPECN